MLGFLDTKKNNFITRLLIFDQIAIDVICNKEISIDKILNGLDYLIEYNLNYCEESGYSHTQISVKFFNIKKIEKRLIQNGFEKNKNSTIIDLDKFIKDMEKKETSNYCGNKNINCDLM